MILGTVMDELAASLDTIAGLRVFAYPPAKVTPPAAIVTYPDELIFDATYGRGMDRITLPIIVVVGKASDRAARDVLTAYCAGAGASSVKAVIEGGTYTAFHTVRVTRAEFDVVRIAGADYIAGMFDLDVAGQGD
jgi:hypothetical protein